MCGGKGETRPQLTSLVQVCPCLLQLRLQLLDVFGLRPLQSLHLSQLPRLIDDVLAAVLVCLLCLGDGVDGSGKRLQTLSGIVYFAL